MVKRAAARQQLRLYVAGSTARSNQAIRLISRMCSQYLEDCSLEIVDVYQQPELAREDNIIAVPSVVRRSPGPVRRLIGDLSDGQRLRHLLDLPPEAA